MSNFTIIHHDLRLKMGLSCNEYCVGDLIRRLSENTNDGWCYASRSKIGEMLGLTKPTVITILNIMISLNLIEVNPKTKDLKVSDLWLSFFDDGKDSLLQIGKDSLPKRIRNYTKPKNEIGKDSLPNRKDSLPIGQDSLPQIGKDSLPPSNKEILLKIQLEEQLNKQNANVEKNDDCFDEFSIVDSEEKKEEPTPKVPPKGSPRKKKKDTPEELERKRLHTEMKNQFENKFPEYQWGAKEGSATDGLIKKLKKGFIEKFKREPSFEDSINSFIYLINHLPEFYIENLDLKTIESKYNAVVTKIKSDRANGKSNSNNGAGSAGVGTDHHKSAVELLIEDFQRNGA